MSHQGVQVSALYQQKLRDVVRQQPLNDNEVRRVKGLGGSYIAYSEAIVDPGYTVFCTLEIDSVSYTVYNKPLAAEAA